MRLARLAALILVILPTMAMAESRLDALLAERAAALALRAEVAERARMAEIEGFERMVDRALDPARDLWFDEDRRDEAAGYRAACLADDLEACLSLAGMYSKGEGTWADPEVAVALQYRGCRAGHGPSCKDLYYHRTGDFQTPTPDHVYFERTCAERVGASCLLLADIVHHGYGDQEGDPELYEELRALACSLGEDAGCGPRWGPRVSVEEMIGRCEAEDAGACNWVGRYGRDLPEAEKLAYLGKSCDLGDAEACKHRADTLRVGLGVPPDPALALLAYERACELSAGHCKYLAALYTRGDLVPYDPDRAQALFRKACEARRASATEADCAGVTRIGEEVSDPTDPAMAANVPAPLRPRFEDARTGCRDADAAACRALGHLYHALRPHRGKNDWHPEMRRAFTMACDLGDHRGCVTLTRHRKDAPAREILRAACEAGTEEGCVALVFARAPLDLETAWASLNTYCEEGVTAACRVVGRIHAGYRPDFGALVPESRETAMGYLDPACAAGDGAACTAAGYALSHMTGGTKGAEKAAADAKIQSFFERGCALEDPDACDRLAGNFLYPDEGEADREAAYPLAIKACALGGDCDGMHRLRLYEERAALRAKHGDVGAALIERYEDFLPWSRARVRRARALCRDGDLDGCIALAGIYDNSDSDTPALVYDSIDWDWANALYLDACEAGHAVGCAEYGDQFRYGSWHDERVALDYGARACELGAVWGCYAAGTILDDGVEDVVAPDAARAAKYFGMGCDLGLAAACEGAARLDDLDPATKAAFEQRACVHGDGLSCEFLGDDHRRSDPELAKAYYRIGCEDSKPDFRATC